jgi:hypothetical protein
MPGLLRFFKVPKGPASPLWWVARTPFALMQQCRSDYLWLSPLETLVVCGRIGFAGYVE